MAYFIALYGGINGWTRADVKGPAWPLEQKHFINADFHPCSVALLGAVGVRRTRGREMRCGSFPPLSGPGGLSIQAHLKVCSLLPPSGPTEDPCPWAGYSSTQGVVWRRKCWPFPSSLYFSSLLEGDTGPGFCANIPPGPGPRGEGCPWGAESTNSFMLRKEKQKGHPDLQGFLLAPLLTL